MYYFYENKDRKSRFKSKCRECTKEHHRKTRRKRSVGDTSPPKNINEARSLAESLGLSFISSAYKGTGKRYKFKCSCGNLFETTYTLVRTGQRCSECSLSNLRERSYKGIEWLEEVFKEGGNILLDSEYKGVNHKYRYICDCGNEHSIRPDSYMKGTRCAECGIEKMSGSNNPMWNNSLTDEDRSNKRNYPGYSSWRDSVKKLFDGLCFICGETGEVVHHIKPHYLYKELRTEESNGVLLCNGCHKYLHKNIPLDNMNLETLVKYSDFMFPTTIEVEVGEFEYDTIIS